MSAGDVVELLYQIHLERAADAAVLQCHKALVAFAHYATLLNQRSVDIHFTYVVYNHSKLDSLLIAKDTIEQSGLAATKVTSEQQHWQIINFHFQYSSFNLFATLHYKNNA